MSFLSFRLTPETYDIMQKSCLLRMKSFLQESSKSLLQKEGYIKRLLEKYAPGVPRYNRHRKTNNPVAYHKYMTPNEGYSFYVMEYMILKDNWIMFWGFERDREHTDINLCSWYR